ncbi:gamma-glutamyl-gamma-aminobutyrate hydrolase family protein [Cytobacillus firmus]|jgi:putative glutamine amidotransferase|uniref:Gamma-glutamyl-gamma-aminobutyrate hydrolase family protein n=1 Tax=Cytobacillus firmus TaxID=1399 RepID=A0AA46PA10_CYTFI|nr:MULTISPECIES: gamma-glutamyl-gamma-aminobutyrate hydrolase family protein [Bacillaceae]KML43595.1 gamma-glutamyl-gamma-aminobutyrate hydrolase [Cytobacillus firmus]MCC3645908.1 gamma-glutamyl-gamma-aminobutyrate hydrolase family protein [Cytobacillus oceanisediminis]MCS0652511.1 gamma-glutamyl-gamma-aminobutyrate hydrolase family protein [Cytobacillus firmus]MCU1804293.1 gamma-glutamyl-gamma-aminobutyrate hydrolase family protein [Cytobacillus firmus]URT72781.1 gamma-glutamyl-gamma-aminobut
MKPIIGVTSNLDDHTLSVSMDNIHSLLNAGAVPVVVPNLLDDEKVEKLAETLDGLLLTGGGDIDPTLFGEEPHQKLGSICPERDVFEISMIQKVLARNKPILAICRGCQVLSIALGGDMYQDIFSQIGVPLLQHGQKAPRWHATHFVNVKRDSLLHKVTGMQSFKVNSYHHQAVRKMPENFEVCAEASDGVIEAFESTKHRFALGVQWHPECMTQKNDDPSNAIFDAFVKACSQ